MLNRKALYSTFLPVNSSHFWENGKSNLSKYLLCSAISEQVNLKKSKCKVFRDTETGNIIIEKPQDLDLAFCSKGNYKFMGYKILCYININSDAGTDVNIKKAFKDDIK